MTMKYSTKLSDAVHIMIFIHLNPNMDLSSQAIAKSLKSNPSFVRQILMKLRTAGLVQSVRGRPRPKLARDPGAISLLEIRAASVCCTSTRISIPSAKSASISSTPCVTPMRRCRTRLKTS